MQACEYEGELPANAEELKAKALLPALSPDASTSDAIEGRVSVVDGDTLEMQGMPIRLYRIDAPESGQLCKDAMGKDYRCGQVAALALADKVGAAMVFCDPREFERYGRVVAVCRLGSDDLNGWLVVSGFAAAYRQYLQAYVAADEQARQARAGIWAGSLEMPWIGGIASRAFDACPASRSFQATVPVRFGQ